MTEPPTSPAAPTGDPDYSSDPLGQVGVNNGMTEDGSVHVELHYMLGHSDLDEFQVDAELLDAAGDLLGTASSIIGSWGPDGRFAFDFGVDVPAGSLFTARLTIGATIYSFGYTASAAA